TSEKTTASGFSKRLVSAFERVSRSRMISVIESDSPSSSKSTATGPRSLSWTMGRTNHVGSLLNMQETHGLHVKPALPAEEIERRFERIQKTLPAQWKLIGSLNQYEQTMVVVPSISIDAEMPGLVLQAYEERFLFLLLLLRKPRMRVIYVTSQPILPSILGYYLGLLPGVIGSHAQKRFFDLT